MTAEAARNFDAIPRRSLGRAEWDGLVEGSPEGWLWHRFDLQDALDVWEDRSDQSFAIVDAAGAPLAVVPLHLVAPVPRRGRPRRFESLGGPAYQVAMGPIERVDVEVQVASCLRTLARRHRAVSVQLTAPAMAPRNREGRAGPNPFLRLGARDTSGRLWVVDLRRGEDAVWSGMEGRARTTVRKATRSGVTVRLGALDDLETYWRLHCETYRRSGARPHPRAYFETIWDRFLGPGLAEVLIAEVDGTPVAAQCFGRYKQAAVYWVGASTSDGMHRGANSLLQWEGLRAAIAAGAERFESGEAFFSGDDPKLVGLSDFKKSFGGTLEPMHRGEIATAGPAQEIVLRIVRRMRR